MGAVILLSAILLGQTGGFVVLDYDCKKHCTQAQKWLIDNGYKVVDPDSVDEAITAQLEKCNGRVCKIKMAREAKADLLAIFEDDCIFITNLKTEAREMYKCFSPEKYTDVKTNSTVGTSPTPGTNTSNSIPYFISDPEFLNKIPSRRPAHNILKHYVRVCTDKGYIDIPVADITGALNNGDFSKLPKGTVNIVHPETGESGEIEFTPDNLSAAQKGGYRYPTPEQQSRFEENDRKEYGDDFARCKVNHRKLINAGLTKLQVREVLGPPYRVETCGFTEWGKDKDCLWFTVAHVTDSCIIMFVNNKVMSCTPSCEHVCTMKTIYH